MFVQDTIDSIMEPLGKMLSSKTVIGEPVQFGNLTLIPVVDVTFGFGAGGGEGTSTGNCGTGGGGGGGARVAARAVIVIKDGEVSVMPLASGGAVEKILDSIPGLIEKFQAHPERKVAG